MGKTCSHVIEFLFTFKSQVVYVSRGINLFLLHAFVLYQRENGSKPRIVTLIDIGIIRKYTFCNSIASFKFLRTS